MLYEDNCQGKYTMTPHLYFRVILKLTFVHHFMNFNNYEFHRMMASSKILINEEFLLIRPFIL